MFTDRLQIFNLFQAPDSAEANCGADGAQYSAQFTALLGASFGLDGTMYVLSRTTKACSDYPTLGPA